MSRNDPYHDFARIYDAWQALYPRPFAVAIAPYVEKAVRRHGVPACTLADLACGTGTFALWWAKTHPSWPVTGQDASPSMIRVARRAARRSPRSPKRSATRFLVQDLRALDLPEPVGLLTCLFDSVNHIRSAPALASIFRNVRGVALPGALLVFDVIDPDHFEESFSGYSISEGPDLYVGMQMESRRGADGILIGEALFTFFSRRGAGWRKHESKVVERAWRGRELATLLDRAGFEILEVRAIDPAVDPDAFVPRLLYVARAGDVVAPRKR